MSTRPADLEAFRPTVRMRFRDTWRTVRVAWSCLAAVPGLFLNVFLGLGGFLLALLSLASQGDNLPSELSFLDDPGLALLTGFLLLVAIFLLIISMVTTYWFARPDQFAIAAVQGKSTRFILGFISLQIQRLCRKFTKSAERANKLLSLRGGLRWRGERRARLIRGQVICKLTRRLEREQKTLLRLMALKVAAAESLGVNERRLCDHVFQFSPVMFDKGTRRYVAAWRLVEAELGNGKWQRRIRPKERRKRLEELRDEIVSITESCHRRVQEQIRLRRMEDLHEDVVRFAASLSTSESLLEYAFTLAKATPLEPNKTWPLTSKNRWLQRMRERLRFAHRKQQAHPGYDLHTLLTSLCRRVRNSGDYEMVEWQVRLLEAISSNRYEDWRNVRDQAPEFHRALVTLPLIVADHERRVGTEVARSLTEYCGKLDPPPSPRFRFLVTLGYSRTVLKSIVRVLREGQADRAFLIADREAEQLSCRLMKTDLRMLCGDKKADLLKSVAAGPSPMLLGMIQPGDRVTLVLGAEVFDKDRQVAHPRLLDDTLKRFIRCVSDERNATLELVVLAADYKRIDRRLALSRFYVDHFDGVSILGPPTDTVSTILTESGPY